MRTIATIEGESIVELTDGTVTYHAKMAIDSDGIGPHYNDPWAQDETSLKLHGISLNADIDKYIVVPPAIIKGVKGIVLGCQAKVMNISNGMTTDAVVGDIGPRKKLGEASIATARAVGVDWNPVFGGVEEHIIHYSLKPGTPAVVDGREYHLQPYAAS